MQTEIGNLHKRTADRISIVSDRIPIVSDRVKSESAKEVIVIYFGKLEFLRVDKTLCLYRRVNFFLLDIVLECEEYSSQVVTVVEALPLLPDSEPLSFKVASCEYSNVPLIVGGEEVNVGEFPHMVRKL